jgi:hypothetical protein
MRSAGGAETFLKFFLEETAVGQAGQRVVPRQISRLTITLNPANHHCDVHDEYYKEYIIDFPFGVSHREMKQSGREVKSVRRDPGEQRYPKEHDGVSGVSPSPIEPIGAEYA